MTKEGKIIAIVGASRSGKSFIARKLAKEFNAEVFLEGEEGEFPKRIEEDIRENIRPLERILWFRNLLVKQYLQALELKAQGKNVVIDVYWIANSMYFDVLLKDFELELMHEHAAIDFKFLPFPDLVVFLKTSEEKIREFTKLGGRSFDTSEDVIVEQLLPLNEKYNQFFANPPEGMKFITVDRSSKDFDLETDFKELIEDIKSAL